MRMPNSEYQKRALCPCFVAIYRTIKAKHIARAIKLILRAIDALTCRHAMSMNIPINIASMAIHSKHMATHSTQVDVGAGRANCIALRRGVLKYYVIQLAT